MKPFGCARLLTLLAAFVLATPAGALPITLTLVPSSAVVSVGQTLSVDVVVDGLVDGDLQEIPLESLDLDLQFDTSRLQFTSLSFGTSLGDPNNAGQTFVSGPGNPNGTGVVLMLEFSLLTGSQLLALQGAPFTLATLQFEALAQLGSAQLAFANLDASSLGSVGGVPLGVGFGLATPSALLVTVAPEPGVFALLGAVLIALSRGARAARS